MIRRSGAEYAEIRLNASTIGTLLPIFAQRLLWVCYRLVRPHADGMVQSTLFPPATVSIKIAMSRTDRPLIEYLKAKFQEERAQQSAPQVKNCSPSACKKT